MKTLSAEHPVVSAQLEVKGVTPDDADLQTVINISQVLFQSEPALQFLIPKDLLSQPSKQVENNKSTEEAPTVPTSLSDIQTDKAHETVNKALLKAERTKEKSLLVCLRIDQIKEYDSSSGAQYVDNVIAAFMDHLTALAPSARALIRYSEDLIVLLVDIKNLDIGREFAEQLSSDIAANNYSVGDDGESTALSVAIAIKTITDSSESPEEHISQCQSAISHGDKDAKQLDNGHRIHCLESYSEIEVKSEQLSNALEPMLL